MPNPHISIPDRLLQAAKSHVPFDGWGDVTFAAACRDAGIDESIAILHCPRRALDLAVLSHKQGDQLMLDALRATDLSALRFRDRIAIAVRLRLQAIDDPESVRRATTLFALPQNLAEGANLVWSTCDLIWVTLGDTSDDYNYYSKRTILGAVYSATLLYWLGDTSDDHVDTWEFLDRRIDNVMQFEKTKAQLRENPLAMKILSGPKWILDRIKAPTPQINNRPGQWVAPKQD